MVDKLVYRVKVNDVDISRHFVSADVTQISKNSYPTARITIANPLGYYTGSPETSPMYMRARVTIEASRDGGETYFLLLDGVINQPKASVSDAGNSSIVLECIGGKNIDQMTISPNCVSIGPKNDISMVFTGTPESSRGEAWMAPDTNGNYPNGLLYKTGYSYDGITEVFTDEYDMPSTYVPTTNNIYNVIKNICDKYGLVFFIDDMNHKVIVLKKPTQAPFEHSTFSLERGYNIVSITDDSDQRRKYDKVVVIGSGVHAIVGNGPKTYTHIDNEITDYIVAVSVAESLASTMIQNSEAPEWHETTITTGPVTEQIVGKAVLVKDPYLSGVETWRNCVGMSHNISAERWLTTLSFEDSRQTPGKTLAEVIEEAESSEQTSGIAYMKSSGMVLDSDVTFFNPSPAAVQFYSTEEDYVVKPLRNIYDKDNKIYTLDSYSSSDSRYMLREVKYIFNDFGYESRTVAEDGTEYDKYTDSGEAVVTDGGDHIIQTASAPSLWKTKIHSFAGSNILTEFDSIMLIIESNVSQTVLVVFGYQDDIGTKQVHYHIPVVAGSINKIKIPLTEYVYMHEDFMWNNTTYFYFRTPLASVINVYRMEIASIFVDATTSGLEHNGRERAIVGMHPNSRTIYTDSYNRRWLKLGTLQGAWPTYITDIHAEGNEQYTGETKFHQWFKPNEAKGIYYTHGGITSGQTVADVLPGPDSVVWKDSTVPPEAFDVVSTFDDRFISVGTGLVYEPEYVSLMFTFNNGFSEDITSALDLGTGFISFLMRKYSYGADLVLALWDFQNNTWMSRQNDDSLNVIGSADTDGYMGYGVMYTPIGYGKRYISENGTFHVAICVYTTAFNWQSFSSDFDLKYLDVSLQYVKSGFVQSNVYTVIEAVDFTCTASEKTENYTIANWVGHTSNTIKSLISINNKATWNEDTQMYEDPYEVYMHLSPGTDPSGFETVHGQSVVRTSGIDILFGAYDAGVGDVITQYVTYTVEIESRVDSPAAQSVPVSKTLLKINPSDSKKNDLYMLLDADAPSSGTYLTVRYNYIGGDIAGSSVPAVGGRIPDGIDMGPSKTIRLQSIIDLDATAEEPVPGTIDGSGCDTPDDVE